MEKYLNKVDRIIQDYPSATKAKVILYLKDKAQQQATEQNKTTQEVVKYWPKHRIMINEALNEIGLPSMHKKPLSFGKWIFISILTSLVLSVIWISIMIEKYTPILSVDEKKGKILILGGMVDLDANQGSVKVDYQYDSNLNTQNTYKGSQIIEDLRQALISFDTSKSTIKFTNAESITWECKVVEDIKTSLVEIDKKRIHLNFYDLSPSECSIDVPQGLELRLEANVGNIELENINTHFSVKMKQGVLTVSTEQKIKLSQDSTAPLISGETHLLDSNGTINASIIINDGELWLK